MSHPILPFLLLLLAFPAADAPDPGPGDDAPRLTIHERIVIRIMRTPSVMQKAAVAAPSPAPVEWVEKHAPRCVPVISLAAATVTRGDSVDLLLNGGGRLRARLEDNCPALAFYSGFYLRPSEDGKLCADRDAILARSGGECRIDKFRRLVARRQHPEP